MSQLEPVYQDWMVEQALPEDAENIARMHSESFRKTYLKDGDEAHNEKVIAEATRFITPSELPKRVNLLIHVQQNPDKHFHEIAMHDNGQVIGMIYGTKLDGVQEIEALYVDENFHGAGVAQALVTSFIEWSDKDKPIELGVYKENERAKRFYAKMGFEALNDNRSSFYDFIQETTMKREGDAQ